MPGRNYQNSLGIPYAYQGQEKDAETNLLNFELRQYDPRLGRWYNPDPMGQHHSPYLAMSNNPVSSVDPNGGWDVNGGVNIDYTQGGDGAQIGGIPPLQDNTWMYTNPGDRRAIQSMLGTSYEAQQKERILDLASMGNGYKMKDGGYFSTQGGKISATYYTDHSYLTKRVYSKDGVSETYNNFTTSETINFGSYSEEIKMPSWFAGMLNSLRKLDNQMYHGADNYTKNKPIKTYFWGDVPYGPNADANVHFTSVNASNTTSQNPGTLLLKLGKTPLNFTYGSAYQDVNEMYNKIGDVIDGVQYFIDGTGLDPFKSRQKSVLNPNRDTAVKSAGTAPKANNQYFQK